MSKLCSHSLLAASQLQHCSVAPVFCLPQYDTSDPCTKAKNAQPGDIAGVGFPPVLQGRVLGHGSYEET
jgi:hypothetical protein